MSSKDHTLDLVINLTDIAQQVQIVDENKKIGTVQIMPKRRVNLPAGYTVSSNWLALNPKAVSIYTAAQLQSRSVKGA